MGSERQLHRGGISWQCSPPTTRKLSTRRSSSRISSRSRLLVDPQGRGTHGPLPSSHPTVGRGLGRSGLCSPRRGTLHARPPPHGSWALRAAPWRPRRGPPAGHAAAPWRPRRGPPAGRAAAPCDGRRSAVLVREEEGRCCRGRRRSAVGVDPRVDWDRSDLNPTAPLLFRVEPLRPTSQNEE